MLLNGLDYLPYSTSGKCPMETGENHVQKLKKNSSHQYIIFERWSSIYTKSSLRSKSYRSYEKATLGNE
jgi:hypothetical protein